MSGAGTTRHRFAILALLLFVFTFMLQSNEVAATTGLLNQVGSGQLLWVWAGGMASVMLTATLYALIVDRYQRVQLVGWAALVGAAAYLLVWCLFALALPLVLVYLAYYCVIVQHMAVLPLAIWTLGTDAFAVGEARRFFPWLVIMSLGGGLAGNAAAALLALVGLPGPQPTLLLNVGLGLALGLALPLLVRGTAIRSRQDRSTGSPWQTLQVGLAFLRQVPAFRYLSLIVVAISAGYTTIEYVFLSDLRAAFPSVEALQSFYGLFKVATLLAILLLQLFATPYLSRLEFKQVFAVMPSTLLLVLLLALLLPGLAVVVAGNFLARVVLQRVELPARKSFQALVPDERRGRVGAFLDGVLYPGGAMLGMALIGVMLGLGGAGLLAEARRWYLSAVLLLLGGALWAAIRFRQTYETGLLDWRLQRKRQRHDLLQKLDF
ncbi:MAG: hypothetical protein K6U89_03685 [Chloroflexi bacterium]|nr:hypothetical protein [Chloroflexota bacterium]